MIIDAFPLFQELDLLEIRLRELYPVVDRFIITEAPVTHKGDPKPLHFAEQRARFAKWLDKIDYIPVLDMPSGEGIAAIRRREMWQRNAILRGLRDVPDDTVVYISDLDEIPRPHLLMTEIPDGAVITYIQKLFYYNLNTSAPARPWPGTRAARAADVRALSPHVIRNGLGQSDSEYPTPYFLRDAGWHFSYFGGVERIREKQTQFLHQELVTAENTTPEAVAAKVAAGADLWGRDNEQQFTIGPATDLPGAIASDPMRWLSLFAAGWEPNFQEEWYDPAQAQYIADLARQAPEGAIVEIGSWEGRSAVALAQGIAPRVLHCVDTWRGNEAEGATHPSVVAAQERDVRQAFDRNIARLTAGNVHAIQLDWRAALTQFSEPIAFVHLDAAHDYDSVADCLRALLPMLAPGAIVCGDDYYADSVRRAVEDVLGPHNTNRRLWVWQAPAP